jgi:ABC-type glycerol-3-phosphate transport system substrate-binding protein
MKKMMKGALVAVIAAALVLGLASCGGGGGGSGPSAVVKSFYAASGKGDAAAIDNLCEPETAKLIKGLLGNDAFKNQTLEKGKITKTTETIDGDTATVVVSFEKADDTPVNLVRIDGKWKVTF